MSGPIDEKMKQIRDKVAALRYQVQGCTEDEIELLRQGQGVEFLPEMYRQIMLFMGSTGMSQVLDGAAGCHLLAGGKRLWFEGVLKERKIISTKDFFLMMEHHGYQYFFFRTKDKLDDPPVWGQWDDDYFYKLGDSLSTFILEELEPSREKHNERYERRMATVYYYDPEQDDFYGAPHPDPYWL